MRLAILALLVTSACGGGDDDGGGGTPDAPAAVPDAAAPDVARSLSFDLEPSTIAIEGTQVQVFQLTHITATGFSFANGLHYHIFLDVTTGPYLLFDDLVPTSPDVTISESTTEGAHEVIAVIEDATHEEIGVMASRTLQVTVTP